MAFERRPSVARLTYCVAPFFESALHIHTSQIYSVCDMVRHVDQATFYLLKINKGYVIKVCLGKMVIHGRFICIFVLF